jgi:hypothetical protein
MIVVVAAVSARFAATSRPRPVVPAICVPAVSRCPGLPPKVSVLSFVRGQDSSTSAVWAIVGGGVARRLGPGQAPLVAPDGGSVAASSSSLRGWGLCLYQTRRPGVRRYFDAGRVAAVAASWSADSRYLAVVIADRNPVSSGSAGLAVIDSLTGRMHMVASGPVSGASFAPGLPDAIVYDRARSGSLSAAVDLYVSDVTGRHTRRLTRDHRSLNPVWGAQGIAFDRESLRAGDLPAYDIWQIRADGTGRKQLTHVHVPSLASGLVPIGFSGDGRRLLADFEGLDRKDAWLIDERSRTVRPLHGANGESLAGAAVASSGLSVLAGTNPFLSSPSSGRIEAVLPMSERGHTVVQQASQPSWNR